MWSALSVLIAGAVLAAACAFWVLRAYRSAGGGARTAFPALAMCAATAVVGLGTYLIIGRPEMSDQPYAARLEALKHRDPTTYSSDEILAVLHEAMRRNPADPLPYLYSGQELLRQGRAREAARAYDQALRREPGLAEAMIGLGRSLVRLEDGRVTPEALQLFEQAAPLTNDPAPWIYQAMAAMAEGRDARSFWAEAYARMPADDPRHEMARRMSTGAAQ